jgi:hypothetical protein
VLEQGLAGELVEALFGLPAKGKSSTRFDNKITSELRRTGSLNLLTERALNFFVKSNSAIATAVAEANRPPFSQSFVAVSPGITEQQAIFTASEKRLWQVDADGPDADHELEVKDEVAVSRIAACDTLFPSASDQERRRFCHVASIAHPNAEAASLAYFPAIWKAIAQSYGLPPLPETGSN